MNDENQPINWPVGRIAALRAEITEGKGGNAFGGYAIAINHSEGPVILMAQDMESLAKVWHSISGKPLNDSRVYPCALVNPDIFFYEPPPAADEPEPDVVDVEPKAVEQEPPVAAAPVDDDDDL